MKNERQKTLKPQTDTEVKNEGGKKENKIPHTPRTKGAEDKKAQRTQREDNGTQIKTDFED